MAVKAVIAGVAKYESKYIPDLPAVKKDVDLVHDLFSGCGIDLIDKLIDPGRTDLFAKFRSSCRSIGKTDHLILYFSGHGQAYRGSDYLVPADAVIDDFEMIKDYLVPVDLAGALRESNAASITMIIDACREGIELETKGIFKTWSYRRISEKKLRLSIVYSCASGRHSHIISEDLGSMFTASLCEAINSRDYAEGTISNVFSAAQIHMNINAERYKKPRQEIYIESYKRPGEPEVRIFPDGELLTKEAKDKPVVRGPPFFAIAVLALVSVAPIVVFFIMAWGGRNPRIANLNNVSIACGPAGGTYDHFCNALTDLLQRQCKFQLDVHKTAGSLENLMERRDDGRTWLMFSQADIIDNIERQRNNVRSDSERMKLERALFPPPEMVVRLSYEQIHIVTLENENNKIRFLEDLQGKTVGIGPENSGTRLTALTIKEKAGISFSEAVGADLLQSLDQLFDGSLHAFVFVGSAPLDGIIKDPRHAGLRFVGIRNPEKFQPYERDELNTAHYDWIKNGPVTTLHTIAVHATRDHENDKCLNVATIARFVRRHDGELRHGLSGQFPTLDAYMPGWIGSACVNQYWNEIINDTNKNECSLEPAASP